MAIKRLKYLGWKINSLSADKKNRRRNKSHPGTVLEKLASKCNWSHRRLLWCSSVMDGGSLQPYSRIGDGPLSLCWGLQVVSAAGKQGCLCKWGCAAVGTDSAPVGLVPRPNPVLPVILSPTLFCPFSSTYRIFISSQRKVLACYPSLLLIAWQ